MARASRTSFFVKNEFNFLNHILMVPENSCVYSLCVVENIRRISIEAQRASMLDHRRIGVNWAVKSVRKLASLFVDHAWIARGLLGIAVLAAIVSETAPNLFATALVLLFGFLGMFLIDIASSTRGALH